MNPVTRNDVQIGGSGMVDEPVSGQVVMIEHNDESVGMLIHIWPETHHWEEGMRWVCHHLTKRPRQARSTYHYTRDGAIEAALERWNWKLFQSRPPTSPVKAAMIDLTSAYETFLDRIMYGQRPRDAEAKTIEKANVLRAALLQAEEGEEGEEGATELLKSVDETMTDWKKAKAGQPVA